MNVGIMASNAVGDVAILLFLQISKHIYFPFYDSDFVGL